MNVKMTEEVSSSSVMSVTSECGAPSMAEAKVATSPTPVKSARRGRKPRDPYTEKQMIFGPKSKLIPIDLVTYFVNPLSWDLLTEEQQRKLKEKLPPYMQYGPDGRLSFEFLKYDMNWKSDLRRFQEDLESGHYEQEWLTEAKLAMEERAAGEFDDWKLSRFEEYWGQKMDAEDHTYTLQTEEIKMIDLITEGVFQVGDIWAYSRIFGKGKNAILIEHRARITEIDDYAKFKFVINGPTLESSPEKRTLDEAFGYSDKDYSTKAEDSPNKQPKLSPDIDSSLQSKSSPPADKPSITPQDSNTTNSRPYNTRRIRATPVKFNPVVTSKSRAKPKFPLTVYTDSPKELEKKILVADGRHKANSEGDPWKFFWCKRDGVDLGSLWQLREKVWLKKYG
jgi:hypothetical protein